MDKRKKIIVIASVLAGLLVVILAVAAIYKMMAPSTEKKELSEVFGLKGDEVGLIVDNEYLEEKALKVEKEIYVPSDVAEKMDERIFIDKKEKILSYATKDGVIQAEADAKVYTVGRERNETEVPILLKKEGGFYVSLTFIKKRSSSYVAEYDAPARLMIMANRTATYKFAVVNEDIRVRTGPNKKFAWLTEIKEGSRVFVEEDIMQENEYQAVTTMDGVTGYIPLESIEKTETKAWEFEKTPESFSQIAMEETVCLGWHQATNATSASSLPGSVSQAGAMNVISPTWFALSDNEGNFTSFADTAYVTQAHAAGLQVWALINDFEQGLDLEKILGTTTTRTKLVNSLVAKGIQYNLDGINIDFENITAKSGKGYLQFLRELVLKCHANDLIVSVDNYAPASYNTHYNLEEQGRIVDYVILMAYDEHYAGSEESGSVSSIGFVEKGLQNVLKKVPKERVITALPFYTRLWKEVKTKSGVDVSSAGAYGMSGAESLLRSHGVTAKWDDETEQYYAQYKESGATYKIWLEEETSLKKKLKSVMKQKIAGVAFWKLGFERAVTWTTIQENLK